MDSEEMHKLRTHFYALRSVHCKERLKSQEQMLFYTQIHTKTKKAQQTGFL